MEKLQRNDSKLNLKIQLKNAASKKLRLRIWGNYSEIIHVMILQHKTYSITSEDDDFKKWEDNQLKKVFGT